MSSSNLTPAPTSGIEPDSQTDLFQTDHLCTELERVLASCRLGRTESSLALLQLENFYEIKRWVGKSEASLLLRDIVAAVQESLPPDALLCRCAHYEFGLLLSDACSLDAIGLSEQIKSIIHSAASENIPPQLEFRCGIGIVRLNKSMPSAAVALAHARYKLRTSLHHARSHALGMSTRQASPTAVLQQLREALKHGRLEISFQAIAKLLPGGVGLYELRCNLSHNRTAPPASLLFEVATQNALGEVLDRWVIERALGILRTAPERIGLTVNLTQNTLVSSTFIDWLGTRLENFEKMNSRLIFQISELDVLIAQHHLDYFCAQLEKFGIQLCVSHFGCTEDPFRYLSLLKAHFVKLDVSLLEKINAGEDPPLRLEKWVLNLQKLHIQPIAPRIDNLEMLPLLWRSKIYLAQGNCLHPSSQQPDFQFMEQLTLSSHARNNFHRQI